jgi:hypothetical protein
MTTKANRTTQSLVAANSGERLEHVAGGLEPCEVGRGEPSRGQHLPDEVVGQLLNGEHSRRLLPHRIEPNQIHPGPIHVATSSSMEKILGDSGQQSRREGRIREGRGVKC